MEHTTPMKLKPLVNATCKLGKKGCFDDGRCHALGNCENKIVTNADRIRAMEIGDLATFLMAFDMKFGEEYEGWASCVEWLQSEAE